MRAIVEPTTTPTAPSLGPLPRLLRAMLRLVLSRLFVFEFRGLERLPSGGFIAACNHPAWLESFTLPAFLPAQRGLRVLAAREVTDAIGWRRWVLDRADAVVPIEGDGSDTRAALRTAIAQLRSGSALSIFPEDLTHPTGADGRVRKLLRGVAFLARAAQSPVVPIGIVDTRELWRGRRIRINIGEPLPPPLNRGQDERFLDELAERIEALRPPMEPLPAHRPWPWLSNLF